MLAWAGAGREKRSGGAALALPLIRWAASCAVARLGLPGAASAVLAAVCSAYRELSTGSPLLCAWHALFACVLMTPEPCPPSTAASMLAGAGGLLTAAMLSCGKPWAATARDPAAVPRRLLR